MKTLKLTQKTLAGENPMRVKFETCLPEIENPACLRPGLMGQDTRGAISDERKFNLDTRVTAIVTFGNSSNQGNKPSSNRISGNCLPGFPVVTRKPKTDACQGLKLVTDGNGPKSSYPTCDDRTQPAGSLSQSETIGQTSEPKLTTVSRRMDEKTLDKINELMMSCMLKAGVGAGKAPVNGMGCVMPKV